jgi:hypothetical protein
MILKRVMVLLFKLSGIAASLLLSTSQHKNIIRPNSEILSARITIEPFQRRCTVNAGKPQFVESPGTSKSVPPRMTGYQNLGGSYI